MLSDADLISDMQQVFGDAEPTEHVDLLGRSARPRGVRIRHRTKGVGITQDADDLRSDAGHAARAGRNTDGRAIVNRNDLATGMKQIIRDSSGYYLLGYNSSQAPTDGKFHNIKVNVKRRASTSARARATGRTRPTTSRERMRRRKAEAPTAVTTALNDLAAPARDRSAHFWIGTARGENGMTQRDVLVGAGCRRARADASKSPPRGLR